ncbi:hypothetical protein F5Y08DRAFT_22834 [Xylaria arbuscula]|nr:hypothetical protein F5Y08DRAFT_22834 [Xylaria arbuscula]
MMSEELRQSCVAALRGHGLPTDLNELHSGALRLCILRGMRHHDGFGHELRYNSPLPPAKSAAFLRALNARDIMSNRVPVMTQPDQFPYCIWHPQVALEDTYRRLAEQYPPMRYLVGRACAVAGYIDLFNELELLPDVSIAEEARDNMASNNGGSRAIYEAIINSPVRYAILDDYKRTVYNADISGHAVVGLNGDTAVLSSLANSRLKLDDIVSCDTTSDVSVTYKYFNITEDWNVDEAGGEGGDDEEEEEEDLPIEDPMTNLLYLPLPKDLPPGNKNLLILMAAYYGDIDRYHRLRRPQMIRGEHDALVHGIYHSTMFAMYMSSPESRARPRGSSSALRRAMNARFIMNNDLSRITTDNSPPSPVADDMPYQIWYPDLAHSTTYEELAHRRPEAIPAVARACIIADYQEVWDALDWVPDKHLFAEARQSPNPHYLRTLDEREAEIRAAAAVAAVDSEGRQQKIVSPNPLPLIPVYADLVRGTGSRRTPTHLRGHVSESDFDWGQRGAYGGVGADAGIIELFTSSPASLRPPPNVKFYDLALVYERSIYLHTHPEKGQGEVDDAEVRARLNARRRGEYQRRRGRG